MSVVKKEVILSLLRNSDKKDKKMSYELFWGGIYSQWYQINMTINGVVYNCCEQYMMAEKARCFDDKEAEKNILETWNPATQKKIGRKVRGFDKEVWEKVQENGNPFCWNIVYDANYAKFTQNEGLKIALLETEGELVEASPYDKIWGIGLAEDDERALDKSQWKGTNWLGEVITQLREDLRHKA